MSLYAPEPDRQGIDHSNVCAKDLIEDFAKMCKRAEEFDRSHDFLVVNSLVGIIDELQRKLKSFEANAKGERKRVDPSRLVHPRKYTIR